MEQAPGAIGQSDKWEMLSAFWFKWHTHTNQQMAGTHSSMQPRLDNKHTVTKDSPFASFHTAAEEQHTKPERLAADLQP